MPENGEHPDLPTRLMSGSGLLCLLGPDDLLRRLSAGLCALLGVAEENLVGKPWLDIVHPEDRPLSTLEGAPLVNRLQRRDGTYRWVEWHALPLAGGGRLCVLHDVTEHKLALVVARAFTRAAGVADAVPRVLGAIAGAAGWQVGGLWCVDRDAGMIRCRGMWHAPDAVADELESARLHMSFRQGEGLPGRVWDTGEAVWAADIRDDRRFPGFIVAARDGLRSACAFPVRCGADVVGVIELYATDERPRDGRMLEMMEHVGAHVGQFVERKRAEEALHQSQQRLGDVVASAPLMVFVCDGAGHIVLHEGGGLVGLPTGAPLGRSLFDLYPDPEHPIPRNVRKALAGETLTDVVELPEQGTSYEIRFVPVKDTQGRISGVMGVANDVTRRKRAERARDEAEERLRTLLRHAPIIMFALDREGRVTLLEGRDLAAIGLRPGEAAETTIGRPMTEVCHDIPELVESCRLALAGQEHTAAFTLAAKGRHFEACYDPLRDENGAVMGAVGVVLDVTQRKEVEAALQRSALRLIEADRLAALGSLAGGIAHQVNNALTNVHLSLGRLVSLELSRKPVTPVRLHRIELLQDMREGIGRVERIMQELSAFSRVDDGPVGPVDVAELLGSVVRIVEHEMAHRAHLVLDCGHTPPVRGKEQGLRQVFLNVLLNAAQAIPEGEAHLNEIRVTTGMGADGRIVVEVTDTGMGIPPEVLGRIFQPFFTTKSTGQGIGLGLSISRDIVTGLGGDIVADSVLGKGTTMRVFLRAADVPAIAAAEPAPEEAPVAGEPSRSRILIVDDDRPVAAALALELGGAHDVVVAGSGREALEILRNDKEFDLVLCDLMMPELSGMDVYEALRLVEPALAQRFAFMTGGAFTSRARRFLGEVPNPHIDKPFPPEALHELVEKVSRRHRNRRREQS